MVESAVEEGGRLPAAGGVTSKLTVCPRKVFTLAVGRHETRKRRNFWAIVGGSAATARKLKCKLVLVTHH